MAADPKFGSTLRVLNASLAGYAATTPNTAPSAQVSAGSGVADGTQIEEIVFQATATTVAGVLNVFLYDNSTYFLYDQLVIPALTSSTTAVAWREVRRYSDLMLSGTTISLRFAHTVTGNDSIIKVTCTGWDFT